MEDRKKTLAVGLAATSATFLGAAQALKGGPDAAPAEMAADAATPTAAEASIVEQKTADWDLPSERNERVDFWIDFLSGKNYDNTRLWLERVGTYGPMIVEKLDERDMPHDLLYLAMIESGLDPRIESHAAAKGMWQFISETGQRHGLEVSSEIDERSDPLKATDAALDYLQVLNKRFEGSWFLAAASYNTGENRVERILNERAGGQKGDDALFWKIAEHLPRETRDYVPLMIAMGHIHKNPAEFGFHDVEPLPVLSFEEVQVAGGTTLDEVAQAAGVDADAVKDLNPHLIKERVPEGRTMSVRVPDGTAAKVASNLGTAPAGTLAD